MNRTFFYIDKESNKFWNIEILGNSFIVVHGAIGTTGETQGKFFTNEADCQEAVKKLIAERIKKGYIEQTEDVNSLEVQIVQPDSQGDYLKEWEEIVNSDDYFHALFEHFKYLADTPEIEDTLLDLLGKIMDKCTDVEIVNDELFMAFDKKYVITASAPAQKINPKYPKTFTNCLQKHEMILWDDYMLNLGEICGEDFDCEDDEFKEFGISSVDKLLGGIRDYPNCWFFHPEKKNKSGEPMLMFSNHENLELEEHGINVGSAFIYRWADNLKIETNFNKYKGGVEEDVDADEATEIQQWYDSLDAVWQEVIKEELETEELPLSSGGLKKLLQKAYSLYLCDYVELTSFRGIEKFQNLEMLDIEDLMIPDLTPLQALPKLYALSIDARTNNYLKGLAQLPKLRDLTIFNLDSSCSLKGLEKLQKLTSLTLVGETFEDISVVS